MKKIFALLLAIVMVMGLATVASAETPAPAEPELAINPADKAVALQLHKLYEVNGETTEGLFPQETLTFTPELISGPATDKNLTISNLAVNGQTGSMSITLPDYTVVGEYKYKVTEEGAGTQGVTYSDEVLYVTVMVTYDWEDADKDGYALEAEVVLSANSATGESDDDTHVGVTNNAGQTVYKLDTFTNHYDLGDLSVQKVVSGNLADEDAIFTITVTLESENPVRSAIPYSGAETGIVAWTEVKEEDVVVGYKAIVTLTLSHEDTVTFNDIPEGVTYTVKEADMHLLESGTAAPNSDTDKEYIVTYTGADTVDNTVANKARVATGSINEEADQNDVLVTNTKETNVDTGIVMDSVPFVVMAVIAVLGLAAFTAKKRVQE